MKRFFFPVALLLLVVSSLLYLAIRPSSADIVEVLNFRISTFAPVLHPHRIVDADSRAVASALHVGLIARNIDGSYHPRIAESWRELAEGVYEFKIADNITFSNGKGITARDVVDSLCALMQPASPYAWVLASVRREKGQDGSSVKCVGLEAKDEKSVIISEDNKSGYILEALSSPPAWIIPSGPGEEKAYGVVPGAGPYILDKVEADTRIVLKARPGGPVAPSASTLVFNYIPDDAVAAVQFQSGQLDALEINNPMLGKLLLSETSEELQAGLKGHIVKVSFDKIRFVIINKKSLIAKHGFSSGQADAFFHAYWASIDRKNIDKVVGRFGKPLCTAFPLGQDKSSECLPPKPAAPHEFPEITLQLLTNNDPFSDQIAFVLPKRVGNVSIKYTGLDSGIFIQRLVKGEYELLNMSLEAVMNSPYYWVSFFTPGSPFVAFGSPIAELKGLNLDTQEQLETASELIDEKGNWVPLFQEIRYFALSPRIKGIRMTSTGTASYEKIIMQ